MKIIPNSKSFIWPVLVLGGFWVSAEVMVPSGPELLAVRLALLAGVCFFPFLCWLYTYGLAGNVTRSLQSIGLSFLSKAVYIGGTALILRQFFSIHVMLYALILFFMIFSLTFFAIYLANHGALPSISMGINS